MMPGKYFFFSWLLLLAFFFKTGDLFAGVVDVKWRAASSQKYDDNVTYVSSNKEADFITTLSAGTVLSTELQNTKAELSLDLAQQLFWKNAHNQNLSEDVVLNVAHEFTQFDRITVSDALKHSYEPLSFEEELARNAGRYNHFRNKFDAGYMRDLTAQLSTKIGYGYDTDRTDRSDLADSAVNRASLLTEYAFNQKSTIFGRYDFLHSKLSTGAAAKVHTVSGGLRQSFTDTVVLTLSGGQDSIDSYDQHKYKDPTWTAILSDQINEKTSVDLSYAQGYLTNPYTSDVLDTRRIAAGINTQPLKKLSASASIFYGHGKYREMGLKDDLLGGSMAFTYDISKNIKGDLSYNYSQMVSNVDNREYRRNVVFLGLSTEF
jgi:hypothetical protein